METTTIIYRHPNGAEVTYVVALDPRTGMATRESYDGEVARIVQQGHGLEVTTEVRN